MKSNQLFKRFLRFGVGFVSMVMVLGQPGWSWPTPANRINKGGQPEVLLNHAMWKLITNPMIGNQSTRHVGVNVVLEGITHSILDSLMVCSHPIYIIDGVQMPSSEASGNASPKTPLDIINSNDIISIHTLTGASAKAIYGVQGAHGVVIITTQRGKAGTALIKLNTPRRSNITLD